MSRPGRCCSTCSGRTSSPGHDLNQLIDRITAAPPTGARSIASVLHGRLQAIKLDEHAHDVTWARRTPETAHDVAHEVAGGLDSRLRELGERAIAGPQPWLLKHLGMLNPNASLALREDYARRAGIAAGYREAAGITDPERAISPEPHRTSPELDAMREATMRPGNHRRPLPGHDPRPARGNSR